MATKIRPDNTINAGDYVISQSDMVAKVKKGHVLKVLSVNRHGLLLQSVNPKRPKKELQDLTFAIWAFEKDEFLSGQTVGSAQMRMRDFLADE